MQRHSNLCLGFSDHQTPLKVLFSTLLNDILAQGVKKHYKRGDSTNLMSQLPRKAPASIREAIADALRDPKRRFLDGNSSSRNHLSRWDLPADGFFADLADGLENDQLYLKPKTKASQPQKYQCVLSYPEELEYPELDIHVTLSPKGDPPRVKVAVHESDTLKTLPRIFVTPKPDENPGNEQHDN
jgi:hypothetical protein